MKNNNRKKYFIDIKKVASNIFILLLVLMLSTIISSQIMGTKHIETTNVVISSNDTLWGIAKEISRNSGEVNVQNVIIKIKEINQMEDSNIYVGQKLLIPVY